MSDVLRETPANGVVLLRLNRPKKLNALSNDIVTLLGNEMARAGAEGAGAVIIAGDARAFAAGADLDEFLSTGPQLEAWDHLWQCELPLVAAVRGIAFGGGLELAMSCDMIVAAEDARLGQPEIKLGLMPGAGGTQRLTRAVGKALATEMVLLGAEMSGRAAYERGLVNRCVPSERVEPTAVDLAAQLAAGAPLAVRAAKRALAAAYEMPLGDALAFERNAFYELLKTEDGREGVRAFAERRKPQWKGR